MAGGGVPALSFASIVFEEIRPFHRYVFAVTFVEGQDLDRSSMVHYECNLCYKCCN